MTKQTKWHVRSLKTLISLGIRPVWSESSLSAWRKIATKRTAKTLTKFDGWPGWSESSLDAQSFSWFCHEATHIYVASLGWGKGCIMYSMAIKNPYRYILGEMQSARKHHHFRVLFFFGFFSNLQVTRTGIRSRTSLISGQIRLSDEIFSNRLTMVKLLSAG